jgi:hypothetical protein
MTETITMMAANDLALLLGWHGGWHRTMAQPV